MQKKYLFVFLLLLLALTACTSNSPDLNLEADQIDLGEVVNGDIVKKEVVVTNIGQTLLVVEAVSTSCGCTTAVLEPMAIQPGENGVLRIEFDSGAHGPEQNGELVRQIFIASNDPQQPEAVVEITANVVARSSP